MSFAVAAEAYDRFMGRYSCHLSAQMADLAAVRSGQRVLDVGCGPGTLTSELVARLGADSVVAVDPSASFVAAARERNPGVRVEHASAEHLPFEDATFDATLAQLVVHFMTDPVAGLAEMARVTRTGGAVAACVWDHAGGHGPLSLFWDAVRQLDPSAAGEAQLPGTSQGDLARILTGAGLADIEQKVLTVSVEHATFEEWWRPFEGGVGPAGAYVASLPAPKRDALREQLRSMHPAPPFVVEARAWAARGDA